MSDGSTPATTADLGTIEREVGALLQRLAPAGSGPEARRTVMTALASILGMYLAGDLAKIGRTRYRLAVGDALDRMQGVAELQATQMRSKMGLGKPSPGRVSPPGVGRPPEDLCDPDGSMSLLLSSLGALIHLDEPEWWQLPGWPDARARLTPEGLEVLVPAADNPDMDGEDHRYLVRRVSA